MIFYGDYNPLVFAVAVLEFRTVNLFKATCLSEAEVPYNYIYIHVYMHIAIQGNTLFLSLSRPLYLTSAVSKFCLFYTRLCFCRFVLSFILYAQCNVTQNQYNNYTISVLVCLSHSGMV